MNISAAATSGFKIQLEIGILARHFRDVLNSRAAKRRSSQVRVEYHSGGVDHTPKRKLSVALDISGDRVRELADLFPDARFIGGIRADLGSNSCQCCPRSTHSHAAGMFTQGRLQCGGLKNFVQGWN